jgi:hypothetical protein
MSNSSLTSAVVTATQAVQDLTRQERPAASLTLTRTAVQAVTTAGAAISWQSQVRGQGFAWTATTTDITIPTSGYYLIQVHVLTSANVTSTMTLTVGGVTVDTMGSVSASRTGHMGSALRYFTIGDVFSVFFVPSANINISQVAYGSTGESPFIHVVQLTSVVT